MKISFFPGCSLGSSALEFGMSIKKVCQKLDIKLTEVNDWTCCGTTPAHTSSKLLPLALPVSNLIKVEENNSPKTLAIPCVACYSRFKAALHEMDHDPALKKEVEQIIGKEYQGSVEIVNLLDFFIRHVGLDSLKSKLVKELTGLKVVCYYGCVLTRPPKVMQFDICEHPMSMDNIVTALGAESFDWPYKTECCGATFTLIDAKVVLKLSNTILHEAQKMQPDAIVVACQLCQANLDMRQKQINKKYKTKFNIPIIYFTQLVGLALGFTPKELGMDKHNIDPRPLLKGKKII